MVTGASDGIGRGFARELARRGFNVVLHGRNLAKLESVKNELSKEFGNISFRTIIVDASKSGPDMYKEIEAAVDSLKGLHVTVLINNVGGGRRLSTGGSYSTFDKDKPEDIDGLINVNARFPAQFTSAMLPLLMAHHGPSLIVIMGSMAEAGSPWLSVYSGAKAFDMSWSRSLAREMHGEGRDIEVMGILTAQVTDTTHNTVSRSVFIPDSRTYAAASLDRVGCGEYVVPGYWGHALLNAISDSLPGSLFSQILIKSVQELIEKESKQQ